MGKNPVFLIFELFAPGGLSILLTEVGDRRSWPWTADQSNYLVSRVAACPRNQVRGEIYCQFVVLMWLSWMTVAIVASEVSKPPRLYCLVAFGGAHDALGIALRPSKKDAGSAVSMGCCLNCVHPDDPTQSLLRLFADYFSPWHFGRKYGAHGG
jgi:hypothetical protein